MSTESNTDDLNEYRPYPNVGIKKSDFDDAKEKEREVFNDYPKKTDEELEWIKRNIGGVGAFAAKVELKNRTKLSKIKKVFGLIFILIIGLLSIFSFAEYISSS